MSALLLDTHVLLWWLLKPRKLSRQTYALVEQSDVAISVISLLGGSPQRGQRQANHSIRAAA